MSSDDSVWSLPVITNSDLLSQSPTQNKGYAENVSHNFFLHVNATILMKM